MAVDPAVIGTVLPPLEMTVDAQRLRCFAKAIGEADPIYTEGDALPVPPTFLFGIELEQADPFAWLADLGVDLRRVLHGEQSFIYYSVVHAGDALVAKPSITDVYAKKGGALEFIVKTTDVQLADGSPVAELKTVLVVQNSAPVRASRKEGVGK